MKRLLILGGNQGSCDIVRKAKEMGIYTIVTDWYDEEKSPAKKIADKAYKISISEIDEIVNMIHSENITGVITGFTDSYLEYYCKICEAANLPCYGTLEQFEICTNKAKFKDVCQKSGVPIIPEYDYNNDFDRIKYPVIVKPVDNSGSRGIYKCSSKEELKEFYNKALEFSPTKNVIIEKYIEGQHINMYYTIINGKPILSAMADRYVYYPDPNVAPQPNGLLHPSKYLNEYIKRIDPKVKQLFKELKIQNGIIFVQGFYEKGEFFIYEIGYRLNGGSTFFLIDKCCGYNQLEMLINFAIEGKMTNTKQIEKLEKPNFENKIGFNLVISAKKGKIKELKGIEEIKRYKEIAGIVQMHKEGDVLESTGTTKQIIAHILIVVDTIEKLDETISRIKETISVKDECGNELISNFFDIKNLYNK